MSGWFRVEDEGWEADIVRLPKPWPRSFARADLRCWENRAKMGGRFPSRSELVERWGWTDRTVRNLLAAENWHDPIDPVPAEQLYKARAPRWQKVQDASKEGPSDVQDASKTTPTSTASLDAKGPSDVQDASKEGPSDVHARDHFAEPGTKNQEPGARDGGPLESTGLGEVWDLIVTLDPHADTKSHNPTKALSGQINARLRAEGLEAVLAVVRYVHEQPHRDEFWGPTNSDPLSYTKPTNFAKVLYRAKKAGVVAKAKASKLSWATTSDPWFREWMKTTALPKLRELNPDRNDEGRERFLEWWDATVEACRGHPQHEEFLRAVIAAARGSPQPDPTPSQPASLRP